VLYHTSRINFSKDLEDNVPNKLLQSEAIVFQASFLPETIGASLPETLDAASEFGKDHKYFSWIRYIE